MWELKVKTTIHFMMEIVTQMQITGQFCVSPMHIIINSPWPPPWPLITSPACQTSIIAFYHVDISIIRTQQCPNSNN